MGEFLVRWVVVGGVVTLGLWLGAQLSGGAFEWWASVLSGVWVGFLNALMRPLVLRWFAEEKDEVGSQIGSQIGGEWRRQWVFWRLWIVLMLLNLMLVFTFQYWAPAGAWRSDYLVGNSGDGEALLWGSRIGAQLFILRVGAVLILTMVSWGMGVFFRGRDGGVHWLDYHGPPGG
ncbi:MAG: hypothetical protein WCO60_12560 [Verrucomicrobiota bacterium]